MTVHPRVSLDQVMIDFRVTSKLAGDAFKAVVPSGFLSGCKIL